MNLSKSKTQKFLFLFLGILGISLLLYFLRGFGIITFIPGGLLHLLVLLSLSTGIFYGIIQTLKY